jgi:hypothetical protein
LPEVGGIMIRMDLRPLIIFALRLASHSSLLEKSKKLQQIIDDETAKRFEEESARRKREGRHHA